MFESIFNDSVNCLISSRLSNDISGLNFSVILIFLKEFKQEISLIISEKILRVFSNCIVSEI